MHWAVSFTYGFMYQWILYLIFFLSLFFIFLKFIFQRNHLRYGVIYITKRFRENPEGYQTSLLADHVRWCCTRFYHRSFVISSTIHETTTAGKVN